MEQELQKRERIFKALANRRRLAIISFLKKKKKATVGNVADHLKLSIKSTSKHLAVLAGADIVEATQKNVYRYYQLNADVPAFTRTLISML